MLARLTWKHPDAVLALDQLLSTDAYIAQVQAGGVHRSTRIAPAP